MGQFSNAVNNAIRFAVAVIAACALTAAHAQGNPDANSIQSLSVESMQGGNLVIRVALKNALTSPPVGFTINTPPRIAFDFANTANGLGKSTQDFSEGDLRSANIVQAGSRTRLVVNLKQMLSYDTRIEGNSLLITLQGKVSGLLVAAPSHFSSEAPPGDQKHSLLDVDFHRGKDGQGRIQVDLSDANTGIDIKQQGRQLIVSFLKASLPHGLQRKLDVTDFNTPVVSVDTFEDGENVRMIIEPKGLWEHAAYQTDKTFVVEVKPITEDPTKLTKGSQVGYAGEKLTLNFQNIAVREALYVIGDFINSNNIPMNMVISDSVNGNVTLRLKDVPWDQALDIIMQSRGLDMRKNGNVIQIAPREELLAKEKLALAAGQEIDSLEALRTESFKLSYQKGADLIPLLTNTAQRILTKRGSAVVDKRTNTLFVRDTSLGLEEARKMVNLVDVPIRQVMIEARFVAAGTTFSRTLGGKLSANGPTSFTPSGFTPGTNTVATNTNNGYTAPTTGGTLSMIFGAGTSKMLDLELQAAESDGTTKDIASPRVITADSTPATISQGVQIPYFSTTVAGATPTVSFAVAELSLKVTPHITPDDKVNMLLEVHKDSPQPAPAGVEPAINTNKVETTVLVENGGTVVIGGVYTEDLTDSTDKVPLLGDIPLLGWMFKDNTKTTSKQELLVFITPKILKDTLNLK
jgi:type IV pilus assembly protein PilQ